MSVRLFAGYFLVLAACAIAAFGSVAPEPSGSPALAAGMMPAEFYGLSGRNSPPAFFAPATSFSAHPRGMFLKLPPNKARLAEVE